MKSLTIKLFLAILTQSIWVCSYIILMTSSWGSSYVGAAKGISFIGNLIAIGIVYKIYKINPLDNEKYNNIYMNVNGIIVMLLLFFHLLPMGTP